MTQLLNKTGMNNIKLDDINKYFDFEGYLESIDFEKKVNNQDKKEKSIGCPSCNNDTLVEDSSLGIIVCTNPKCGQVADTLLDYNPEWKQYDDEDKSGGRCSMPINLHLPQSSLGTHISGMGRIKTLHIWNSMPYKERSLNNEFKKIHEVCQKANILKCIEEDARNMYANASKCKHLTGKNIGKHVITRGTNRISISAGCVFYACIRRGMTRTPKEIATLYGIKDADMHKGCKNLLKFLKQMKMNIKMGTSKPEHFVKRYCNELKIKTLYADEAVKISKNLEKLNIASDHTPYSLAAASILLMAELNKLKTISRKKLASQFSISEVTISKTFKEILPYKNILINDDITDKIVIKINNDMKKEEVPLEVLERMKKLGITTNNNIIIKQEVTDEYNFDDIIEDDDFTENYEEISEYCKEKIANAKYILNKLKSSTLEEEIILMRESYLLLSMLNNDLKQFYNDIN